MIDLSDLSIVIPYREDMPVRRKNLDGVLSYFNKFFVNHEIILLEISPEQRGKKFENVDNVIYSYEKCSGLIHRTKALNDGVEKSNRRFISCYDADVVFHPNSIAKLLDKMRSSVDCKFGLCYNGVSLDLKETHVDKFILDFNFDDLPVICPSLGMSIVRKWFGKEKQLQGMHYSSVGGATFFDREVFLELGGYNKKFISWGWEDNEIVSRFSKMGYKQYKQSGYNLIHFNHPRGGKNHSTHAKINNNKNECAKVKKMTKDQLSLYIEKELK